MPGATLFPSLLPDHDADRNAHQDLGDVLDSGECPWCGEEFENARQHARMAHPDEYDGLEE